MTVKPPDDCENMTEIRAEIDRLDRQIVDLLAQRFAYVKAAAQFKTDATSVKAPERLQAMLKQRHAWAEEKGLNGDVIAALYRDLVTYFIDEELKHWSQNKQGDL